LDLKDQYIEKVKTVLEKNNESKLKSKLNFENSLNWDNAFTENELTFISINSNDFPFLFLSIKDKKSAKLIPFLVIEFEGDNIISEYIKVFIDFKNENEINLDKLNKLHYILINENGEITESSLTKFKKDKNQLSKTGYKSNCQEWGVYEVTTYTDGSTSETLIDTYEVCEGGTTYEEEADDSEGNGGATNESAPDQIINNLTGKADCVYGKLESNSLLSKTLEKFVGKKTPVHLILNQQSNLRKNDNDPTSLIVNGKTYYGNSYYITITLNTEQSINRPSLAVVRTILHEAIHAEIFRKIKTTSGLHQNLSGEWELGSGAKADFPTLFNYYQNQDDPQHEYMADYYRTAIEEGLREYATSIGESYPDQLYKDLAWGGLMDTYAWHNMYADYDYTLKEQKRIKDTLKNFNNSGNNECK
jgi:hypothetical protein